MAGFSKRNACTIQKHACGAVRVLSIALLLLPLAFSKPENHGRMHIGLPSVYNGDEPHYLLMINSILHDGDLDLKNNYRAVHQGAVQAGKRFAGALLEHHTFWYVNGTYYTGCEEFGPEKAEWREDKSGFLSPRIKDARLANIIEGLPEYSVHPPGLALLMAPALYFFRDSKMFEPMAIIFTGLIMVAAMIFFNHLLRAYTNNAWTRTLLTAAVFLGSPLWYYARTLYSEGPMTLLAMATYALYISSKKIVLPGLLLGVGVLLKPIFILLALPILFNMARNKEVRNLGRFSIAMSFGICVYFLLNYQMNGSVIKTSQPFIIGNTLSGAWGLLTDLHWGLVLFCPALIIALPLWPAFIREYGRKAWLPAGGFLLYFIVISTYAVWRGGDSYGPRYIVPVIPFILLPLLLFLSPAYRRIRWRTGIGILLILLSIFINANGAIASWKFINRNPLVAAFIKVGALL
jgi:hypothetical protein